MQLALDYLYKARRWDSKKVRTLGGAYASSLKSIYGDKYIHVSLYNNRKAFYERQNKKVLTVFESELV